MRLGSIAFKCVHGFAMLVFCWFYLEFINPSPGCTPSTQENYMHVDGLFCCRPAKANAFSIKHADRGWIQRCVAAECCWLYDAVCCLHLFAKSLECSRMHPVKLCFVMFCWIIVSKCQQIESDFIILYRCARLPMVSYHDPVHLPHSLLGALRRWDEWCGKQIASASTILGSFQQCFRMLQEYSGCFGHLCANDYSLNYNEDDAYCLSKFVVSCHFFFLYVFYYFLLLSNIFHFCPIKSKLICIIVLFSFVFLIFPSYSINFYHILI